MRIAARLGTISLLLVLFASRAWADVIILDFNDAAFAVTSPPPISTDHPLYNAPGHSSHGRVVTSTTGFNQTTGLPGTMPVGISATGSGEDIAIIFDTRLEKTDDGSLEAPFGAALAEGQPGFLSYPVTPAGPGGVGGGIQPGHVLIRAKDDKKCDTGVCEKPESQKDTTFNFTFDSAVFTTGVDLISLDVFDIKDDEKHKVTLTIFDMDDNQIGSSVEVLGTQIGDGNAARLDLAHFFVGNAGIGRFQVALKSAGALSNLVFDPPGGLPGQVPEPASLALLSIGLLGLGVVHRRRRKTPKT